MLRCARCDKQPTNSTVDVARHTSKRTGLTIEYGYRIVASCHGETTTLEITDALMEEIEFGSPLPLFGKAPTSQPKKPRKKWKKKS
jgi:hypothetical protein